MKIFKHARVFDWRIDMLMCDDGNLVIDITNVNSNSIKRVHGATIEAGDGHSVAFTTKETEEHIEETK